MMVKLLSVKFPSIVSKMRYLVLFESRDEFIPSCLNHCKLGGENPKAMQVKLAASGWVTAGSRGKSEKIGKTGEKKGQNELFIKLPQLAYKLHFQDTHLLQQIQTMPYHCLHRFQQDTNNFQCRH